jgi:hypothetical protein
VVGALGVVSVVGLCPQNSAAGTTVEDFLTWTRPAQDGFFQISISMIGTIATQVRPEMATCIDKWYFEAPDIQNAEHNIILELMPAYSTFDPTAFMLAYVENRCGKIR